MAWSIQPLKLLLCWLFVTICICFLFQCVFVSMLNIQTSFLSCTSYNSWAYIKWLIYWTFAHKRIFFFHRNIQYILAHVESYLNCQCSSSKVVKQTKIRNFFLLWIFDFLCFVIIFVYDSLFCKFHCYNFTVSLFHCFFTVFFMQAQKHEHLHSFSQIYLVFFMLK